MILLAAATLLATPARAAEKQLQFNIPAQDLADELAGFARESHIELLFDRSIMVRRRGPAILGLLTPGQALARLLRGSGLVVRETAEGVYVISAGKPAPVRGPDVERAKTAPEVGAVAEILVVGRRSLNVDIPRSENDIQPYEVATSQDIAQSQAETVEDFLRTRLPDDTAFPAAIQEPSVASANPASQVDLRGLGLDQTLVLLDGRRLPSTSLQPDLNGIPVDAIERIEALTSTAGGIYGPDATGGVLNVVLKRDYQGGELSASAGETTRGDAPEWRLSGAFGASVPLTETKIMLAFSHTEAAGLTFGDRGFVQAAQMLASERTTGAMPVAGEINIEGLGSPLTLVPALGGQTLGSTITHLPLSVALTGSSNEAALLAANSGAYDLSLSPDGRGAEQSLLTATKTNSFLFSLRQPIGSRLEAFVDGVYLEDAGVAKAPAVYPGAVLLAGQVGNPFTSDVFVTFPTPGLFATVRSRVVTERMTTGLIAHLFGGWTGEVDATLGRASEADTTANDDTFLSVTPFSGSAAFNSAVAAFNPDYLHTKLDDQLDDYSARLSGPLLSLPGGPLTMTLLAETRYERPPEQRSQNIDSVLGTSAQGYSNDQPLLKEQVSSVYAEIRAPLVRPTPNATIVKGLELQLAVRDDWSDLRAGLNHNYGTTILAAGSETDTAIDSVVTNSTANVEFTAGAKLSLMSGITLRASFATGYLPVTPFPSFSSTTYSQSAAQYLGLIDPQRGGQALGAEGAVTVLDREYPHPSPEKARTESLGIVLAPAWVAGVRMSVDYTRTDTSGGITDAGTELKQYILDHESAYASRIVRAPLAAADAAAGYMVGVVTSLDYSELSAARSSIDSVHFDVSYRRQTRVGDFRIKGQATWDPDLRLLDDPTRPTYDIAGYSDGPLKWRGDLGVDWTRDQWMAALNAQFYGSYHDAVGNPEYRTENGPALIAQGASSIPAQTYIDAVVSYRASYRLNGGEAHAIEYRFGIRNIFDWTPPAVIGPPSIFETVGYSPYGDPRGRRFEFTATAHF